MGTLWIAWTALSLTTAGEPVEVPRPALRAVWVDVAGVAPFSFEAMARESASILQDVGIDLSWERVEVGVLPEDADLTVVLLNSRPSAGLHARCMGAAKPDEAPRAAWVFLPNVLWALGVDPRPGPWSAADAREVGVALGRVAAHEIFHTLAPRLGHASQGLMSERLGRADLQRVRISLDESSRRAIHSALAKRVAQARQ
jgi:hypothetical protein